MKKEETPNRVFEKLHLFPVYYEFLNLVPKAFLSNEVGRKFLSTVVAK